MSGFYIGVDGKARKVKGGYIGIDGKARKIKKGYIGDANGVARLCWTAFSVDPVFANNTWEQIAEACHTRQVPESWAVGDKKTMTVNGTSYTIDIIGKNHDDYADGSGKAPLTFQFNACYTTSYAMNNTDINSTGWMSSVMRQTNMPAILAKMPAEVQSAIREVTKKTSKGVSSSQIINTSDKLFLLSEIEAAGTTGSSFDGEGSQYAYYAAGRSKAKKAGSSYKSWYLRSPYKSNNSSFCCINSSGVVANGNASMALYAAPAFCF